MISLVCEVEYKKSTPYVNVILCGTILISTVLPALKLFCVSSQFTTDHYPFFLPPPLLPHIFNILIYTLPNDMTFVDIGFMKPI